MRVLVVTNMYPSETNPGWGSFVKTQVESLRAAGMTMDVLEIPGYRSKLAYLTAFPRFWRALRRARYDVIHAHYGLSGFVARAQLGTPVILSFCGDDLYGHPDAAGRPSRSSLVFVALHRQLARTMRGVIVKSRSMQALLPPVVGTRAAVIPNGVDFGTFRPLDREVCRQTLGLASDRRYVLFPYAPTKVRKNFGIVQAAVDRLNATTEERWEILVVQDQPNERIPIYMNAADVLVLVSFWEGSPNVVKEALACNLRVVAADVGDVRELIDGIPECAICDRTSVSLATAVAKVCALVGSDAPRRRVEHLSISRVADRVISLYKEAAGENNLRETKGSLPRDDRNGDNL